MSSSDSSSDSSDSSSSSSESDRYQPRNSQCTSRQNQGATRSHRYVDSDDSDDSDDDSDSDSSDGYQYNPILDAPTTRVNMPSGAQAVISKPVDYPCSCHRMGQRSNLITIQPGWQGGNEFEIVQAEMHKTLAANFSHYNIISIKKVQNCCLWKKFRERERKIARELNNKYVNEVMLFHGTSAANAIVRTGFNVAAASPSGMFGPGIYFAEHSSKSNKYAGYLEHKNMLLCRVALGRMLDRTRGDRMRSPPNGYHSVRGLPSLDGLNFPEYVVYHNHQAYPEYLVSYSIGR